MAFTSEIVALPKRNCYLDRTWTRGSPRSCLFLSFSCRLLVGWLASGTSGIAVAGERPKTNGDMTEPQSL
jgi:hypothetical protein